MPSDKYGVKIQSESDEIHNVNRDHCVNLTITALAPPIGDCEPLCTHQPTCLGLTLIYGMARITINPNAS